MKVLLRWFACTLVWTGPALTLLLAVSSGFLMWALVTQQGARWLLASVAHPFEGDVRAVQGTIWHGVRVGELTLSLPGASVAARDVQLAVDWPSLLERRVHVRTLSAGALALDVQADALTSSTSSTSPASPELPGWMAWPVTVELDRLDLAGLDVSIDGKPLPVRTDALDLTARFTAGRGEATIHTLSLAHDLARVAVQGDVGWQFDGLAWTAASVNLRLINLQTGHAPVHVDALALNAHLTPRGGNATLDSLALTHALGNAQAQGVVSWQWQAGDVTAVDVDARLLDGAQWNGQMLSGTLRVQAHRAAGAPPSVAVHDVVQAWMLPALAFDAALGENRVVLDGAFGRAQDRLNLDVHLTALAQFWPQLAGSLRVRGHAGGGALAHAAELAAVFTPENTQGSKGFKDTSGGFLTTPVHATLRLSGVWEHPDQARAAWRARISQLQVNVVALQVQAREAFTLNWHPQAREWPWTIGAVPLQLSLDNEPAFTLTHQQSRLGQGGWETLGAIEQLHVTDERIAQWWHAFPWLAARTGNDPVRATGTTAKTANATNTLHNDIFLDTDWRLRYGDTLEGEWRVRRSSGDLIIPREPPVPAGLRDLDWRATAVRTAPGRSRVQGALTIQTETMGSLAVQVQTQLRGDWQLDTPDATVIEAQSDMADLGWLSLFSNGLPVELGGAVTAHLKAQHRADGRWITQGNVTGKGLRVVYPDEGVRLLDGTLNAHFDDERFVLESLRFPARLRVEPREGRTRTWIKTDPAAQDGNLNVSGDWHLREGVGRVCVTLSRYPLLQRSDRHAMFSGTLHADAALDESKISIGGELTADAGWVDLDIVSGVPSLDGDVIVHRAEAVQAAKPALRTDVALDMSIDLGSRFTLTGYGLDSGLTGKLRLRTQEGRLRADGALDTRGGTVNAYGQQLRLLRGNLTFQGDASSPVLDVVAMRTGDAAVQAGVRVGGTARRPRIDLVSTPDVSDVEKLSWLLLGRGPDNAGGDAVLLLSVGSSFFTGGEPFYRQFGLDELSMRSGALGATGSLLPVETVVRSLDAGVSDIERQFIVASKNISQNFSVSIEQALSDTGTVGRISYRLARGLNASLSVGTVNGLALVYRWFSRD